MTKSDSPPSSSDLWRGIQRATAELSGVAHRTPVITSRTLDAAVGARVFLKCENLQAGVVTHSSGNHAQAVALVGKILDVRTTIVMPSNAPSAKRQATEGYGAQVVEYDPETEDRVALAEQIAKSQGAVLIPPFDHPDIIAGQGTAAVELISECQPLDALLTPVGGGGLLAGCAIAARNLAPHCKVIGVEPELADDANRSFYSGALQSVHNPATIADGTRVSSLGQLNFAVIRDNVDAMCTVSEKEIRDAVRFLLLRTKLLVEPSGVLGVAALVSRSARVEGRVGVILSGGHVDGSTLAEILTL